MMTAVDLRSFPAIALTGLLLFLFLLLVPLAKLLRRTGHHPFWSLFAIFPGLNLIAFWFFAFKPWPIDNVDERLMQD
jgi:hypothetical protein